MPPSKGTLWELASAHTIDWMSRTAETSATPSTRRRLMSRTAWRLTATGRRWRSTRAGHSAVAVGARRPGTVLGNEWSLNRCAGSDDESGVMQIGRNCSNRAVGHRRRATRASIWPDDPPPDRLRHLKGEYEMETLVLCTSTIAGPLQPEMFWKL